MTNEERADDDMKRAIQLKDKGNLYAAGMLWADAARLYKVDGFYDTAYTAERFSLWCLRELCANHLGKYNIIHKIRNLAQQIDIQSPNDFRF